MSARRHRVRDYLLAIVFSLLALAFSLVVPNFIDGPFAGLDRELLKQAFGFQADNPPSDDDPLLFVNVDDGIIDFQLGSAGDTPSYLGTGLTPRTTISSLLNTIRNLPDRARPRIVMLDLDIAWREIIDENADFNDGTTELRKTLSAWANDDSLPPLLLARQLFNSPQRGSNALWLPKTPYDDIVTATDRLQWVDVMAIPGANNTVRWFREGACAKSPEGQFTFLPHAAMQIAAEATTSEDERRKWEAGRQAYKDSCERATQLKSAVGQKRLINYHMNPDLDIGSGARVTSEWASRTGCRPGTEIFTRLEASQIVRSSNPIAPDAFCKRIVVIGADNAISRDYGESPFGQLPGSIILMNAARGMIYNDQIVVDPTRRWMGISLQAVCVIFACVIIVIIYDQASTFRNPLQEFLSHKRDHGGGWAETAFRRVFGPPLRLVEVMLSPAGLPFVTATLAYFLGSFATEQILKFGWWGTVSVPSLVAALVETYRDYHEMD